MHIQRTYDPHRDLLELRGLERPACSNTLVPRGSHHISSLWSPVVATGGNRVQIGAASKSRKQAKTVAVRCGVDVMLREIHLHQLAESQGSRDSLLASQPLQFPLQSLRRVPFRSKPALNSLRVSTAHPVPVRSRRLPVPTSSLQPDQLAVLR